jgi:hypothetical protein
MTTQHANENAGPVSLLVPIRNFEEADLIGALDYLMRDYLHRKHPGAVGCNVTARAARWLADKYGAKA